MAILHRGRDAGRLSGNGGLARLQGVEEGGLAGEDGEAVSDHSDDEGHKAGEDRDDVDCTCGGRARVEAVKVERPIGPQWNCFYRGVQSHRARRSQSRSCTETRQRTDARENPPRKRDFCMCKI